jgi:hypothetical protein
MNSTLLKAHAFEILSELPDHLGWSADEHRCAAAVVLKQGLQRLPV